MRIITLKFEHRLLSAIKPLLVYTW